MHLSLSTLADIAPILWAKWGDVFLETLRQEAEDADDELAFRAVNNRAGIRTILVVCTTDPARIRAVEEELSLVVVKHPVDWENHSIAEMALKTEKRDGLTHQELRDGDRRTALVLCATRLAPVRIVERLFDLPE